MTTHTTPRTLHGNIKTVRLLIRVTGTDLNSRPTKCQTISAHLYITEVGHPGSTDWCNYNIYHWSFRTYLTTTADGLETLWRLLLALQVLVHVWCPVGSPGTLGLSWSGYGSSGGGAKRRRRRRRRRRWRHRRRRRWRRLRRRWLESFGPLAPALVAAIVPPGTERVRYYRVRLYLRTQPGQPPLRPSPLRHRPCGSYRVVGKSTVILQTVSNVSD